MDQTATESRMGPVSEVLLDELRGEVHRHGIVVWLDRDGQYSGLVDALARTPRGFAVHAFRGSHLDLMVALEGVAGGIDKPHLLVHMPGATEEDVRATPLLELYMAGARYRRALTTLVERAAAGKVAQDAIDEVIGSPELTLESADRWLQAELSGGDELATVLRALPLSALVDDLLGGGTVARKLMGGDGRGPLLSHLAAAAGLSDRWVAGMTTGPEWAATASGEALVHALATWVLAVEYVDDLQRAPVSPLLSDIERLPRSVVAECCSLARDLGRRRPEVYAQAALEVEERIDDEVRCARAEDLGRVDTFRFEEDRVLDAALEILGHQPLETAAWERVLDWSTRRLEEGSFWLDREPPRRTAWRLVDAAARLGRALADAGPRLDAHLGHDAAVERYVRVGAAVDQAHRRLEQLRVLHAYEVGMPRYEVVRDRMRALRQSWFDWASDWAGDYAHLCRLHGPLPGGHLQQRHLFEEVVRPLTQSSGQTAYFMVDALRYELAAELAETLAGHSATNVRLDARLAEIPTNTEVGMNLLAPVGVGGRLRPVIKKGREIHGFRAGEFVVDSPETRRRAIAARVAGRTCPLLKLAEVLAEDAEGLRRRIAQARLVVVHSEELDKAGESGAGPATFASVLQQLRAAWHALREAGVRRFVFTADHGFLLLDEADTSLKQPHGQKTTPSRRHVLSSVGADHPHELRVPLKDLGYEAPGLHLMVPETIKVFDRGDKPMSFVHGGNSLQERVIPVLSVLHRAPTGGDTSRLTLTATARQPLMGRHCVAVRVDREQETLGFGASDRVEFVMRVVGARGHRVQVHDVRGDVQAHSGVVKARIGHDFEVFFSVLGPPGDKVQVAIEPLVRSTMLDSTVLRARYAVSAQAPVLGTSPGASVGPASTSSESNRSSWLDELPDQATRDVFQHLQEHGTLTEAELVRLIGSARNARKFGLRLESLLTVAPFDVQVEAGASGKRYVRI